MDENKPNDIHDCSAEPQENKIEKSNDQPSKTLTGKKMAFILGLCLWALLLFISLRSGITVSIRLQRLDLFSFIEPIGDFWFEIILRGHILLGFLLVTVALYPIYYIIDKRKKKKEAKENSNASLLKSDNSSDCPDSESKTFERSQAVNNVMEYMDEVEREKRFRKFSLSFIPYLYILWSGIFGFEFWGYRYGFSAMIIAAAMFSLVPVYPVLLVFQVMFYIFSVRNGKFAEKQKRGTGLIVLTLIGAMLVIGIVHAVIASAGDTIQQSDDREIIEEYLAEEYGEYAEDMVIINYSSYYMIKTPLLEKGYFYVHVQDGVVYDGTTSGDYGFKDVFEEENNMEYVLNDYLRVHI